MTTLSHSLTSRDGHATLSIIGADINKVVASNHPNFTALLDYLVSNEDHDVEHVRALLDPALYVGKQIATVTDRLEYKHNNLFFDGQPLHNSLGRHILAKIEQGDSDWARFVKFLENLDENPSFHCQQALYRWIDANGLTITPEGNFIGYKGVEYDGMSKSAGPNNYVNGVLYKDGASTQVPHEVGSVISKKRAQVDDNRALACSVGLHVGTEEYARGFAPRLLTVEINPRDVVSVPDGDLTWKIRVCEYKVVALAEAEHFASTSVDFDTDVEDDDEYYDGESDEQETVDEVEDVEAYDSLTTDEPETIAVSFDGSPVSERLVVPTVENPTLADWADANQVLKDDLADVNLGHKPLARKWSEVTTEASVRRYRKSNGIKTSFAAKVKDAVS